MLNTNRVYLAIPMAKKSSRLLSSLVRWSIYTGTFLKFSLFVSDLFLLIDKK